MEDEKKAPDEETKEPIDMNTDEALDYIFGSELADELKHEAQALNESDQPTCLPEQN